MRDADPTEERSVVALIPPRARTVRCTPLVGAAVGVLFYLGNLYRENGTDVRPAFGCEKPPGYDVVNLPARALATVYPV
jgi:hypothetical protein